MSSAPAIRVADVSKSFVLRHERSLKERLLHRGRGSEEFWALQGVNVEVAQGRTIGLIGHNGCGKTTLLKLIGGILTPSSGYVERRGRIAALLELGAGFHPDLTGRENVYLNASILGLSRRQTDAYFDDIVDFSGIERFIDNPVKFYSSGMYLRLAFAVAVHVDPEILLVDEVLAVGDEPFQRKCIHRMRQFQREGRTIVFVTHALDLLRQFCDEAVLLDAGRLVRQGRPSDVLRTFREENSDQPGSADSQPNAERPVEITDVTVTDGRGETQETFRPGDSMGVDIGIEAKEPVEDPIVGLALNDHMGMLLYGTNTGLRKVDLGIVEGRRRVRFAFESIPMMEGRYYVSVSVHTRDESRMYHFCENTTGFRIHGDTDEPGVIHLAVRCTAADTTGFGA